jgi:UDP-glucose 4-epimerase
MKKILITGASGSLGNQLIDFYQDQFEIIAIARGEEKLWRLKNNFPNAKLKTIICDMRDAPKVNEVILQEKPHNIIIAHALKQIDLCEVQPDESIKTNILGVSNILNTIKKLSLMGIYSPEKICFVSTDKAAEPISVYGMCKSIAERLTSNTVNDLPNTKVIMVRYGNVLSSNGSILPLLLKQGSDPNFKKFTLTHPEMTRFMMTLQQAVKLIDTAMNKGISGDLWVPKLPAMKILDLMEYFSKKFNKPYELIGIRHCEKIHEIMISHDEAPKIMINNDYFVFNKNNNIINLINKEYSSLDAAFSYEELEKFLDSYLSL